MLSLAQFIAEQQDDDITQGVMVGGVPAAVILNNRMPSNDVEQGAVVDGVPAAVVLNNRPGDLKESHQVTTNWYKENDNEHLGKNADHVEHVMHYQQQHDPDHQDHLYRYTEGSKPLNKALYQHHVAGTEPPSHIGGGGFTTADVPHDVHGLDKAVERHELAHDLHVYAGVHFDPGHVSGKHAEGHMHLPAYTSTTLNKGTAMHFAHGATYDNQSLQGSVKGQVVHGHVLHIKLKKGDKGAYLGSKYSHFPREHEFLLPRNTRLKVHPEPTLHRNVDNGHTYAIWHAETVKQ